MIGFHRPVPLGLAKEAAIIYMAKHAESATREETGRRLTEVEITPAMIEAGMNAVDSRDYADGLIPSDEAVCLVYRAMEAERQFQNETAIPCLDEARRLVFDWEQGCAKNEMPDWLLFQLARLWGVCPNGEKQR